MDLRSEKRRERRSAPLSKPTDRGAGSAKQVGVALNRILADVFALYVKAENFHWHMTGPHFCDYHRMFDEQADQIFALTDTIAERVRKLGAMTPKYMTKASLPSRR